MYVLGYQVAGCYCVEVLGGMYLYYGYSVLCLLVPHSVAVSPTTTSSKILSRLGPSTRGKATLFGKPRSGGSSSQPQTSQRTRQVTGYDDLDYGEEEHTSGRQWKHAIEMPATLFGKPVGERVKTLFGKPIDSKVKTLFSKSLAVSGEDKAEEGEVYDNEEEDPQEDDPNDPLYDPADEDEEYYEEEYEEEDPRKQKRTVGSSTASGAVAGLFGKPSKSTGLFGKSTGEPSASSVFDKTGTEVPHPQSAAWKPTTGLFGKPPKESTFGRTETSKAAPVSVFGRTAAPAKQRVRTSDLCWLCTSKLCWR